MSKAIMDRELTVMGNTSMADHPMIRFTQALDQLKEEHGELRKKLQEFAAIDEIIREGKVNTDWYGTLRSLKVRVEQFMTLLEHHSEWEDTALFPTVVVYAEENAKVIEVLEEDHRLALQYLQAFLLELRRSVSPIHQSRANRIMALLMNAHKLLLDHLRAEENYIYPIAEEIIEDIDYLSC